MMGRHPGKPRLHRERGRRIFACRFTVDGRRYTLSTGETDEQKAMLVATRLFHETAATGGRATPARRLRRVIQPWPLLGGIYFARVGEHVKIGVATSIRNRLATLQTSSPQPIELVGVMPGTQKDETRLHKQWAAAHVSGEWFLLTPDLVTFIRKLERP